MRRLVYIICLMAATCHAQVWWATQDINGVVGPVVTTNVLAGGIRITLTATDSGSPVDLTGATLHMLATERRDSKVIASNTCVAVGESSVRGEVSLSAINSPYDVRIINGAPDDPVTYYWAAVVVTSTPSATLSASISATTTVTLVERTNVVSLSLIPLIASNGYVGTPTIPWLGIAAVTGSFAYLSVSNLDVGGTLAAVDDYARTSSVKLTGSVMTGPLTNTAGYYGDGAGLTNLSVAADGGATNITINGTAGGYDEATRTLAGTVTVAGVADVYAASNNTFARSGNGAVTNAMYGRTIIAAPWEGWGPRAILEMQTSNDVQGIISSVDNGATAEAMLIALKGELVSYAGGGNATVRPSTNAATPSGSWPGITLAQYSSGPWLQFGFFSGAGGVFSNVFDLAWFGAPGPAFRINPDQRSNYFFRVFGVTGESFRITGHEQVAIGTVVPQAGVHISNRTLRVDGRFEIGGNSGRNQLTAGVCNIVLPYRMATTNYIVHVSGETGHDSAAREWVSGKTTSNFVVNGTTSNWFAWTAQGITL